MIKYNGREFETRDITICPGDMSYTVTVAQRELWNFIGWLVMEDRPEERKIDDIIAYYCNEEEWNMSDEELARIIENL